MNGFTVGMKRDLIEVLLQCQMSNSVRVIVITGSNLNDDVSTKMLSNPQHNLNPGFWAPGAKASF